MDKKYIHSILIAVVIFTFFFTSGMLKEGYPKGGDTIGLYDLLLNTVDVLKIFFKTGELRLWNPDYYFGFPMFFFYAPLPYIFLAMLSLATGIEPLFLFKLSIVVLFSSIPIVFYFSARIIGLEEKLAMCIALFSTALSSSIGYGIEYFSFFTIGLYSQLCGIIFLPITIAFVYRYFVFGNCRIFFPVFFLFLTFTSHILSGMIAFLVAVILVLCCLVQPPCFETKSEIETKRNRKEVLYIAGLVFFLFFISVSFLIVPYLLNIDYFSNVPIDTAVKKQGYGFLQTITLLFTGNLLDASPFFRIPVLTILFFVGVGVSLLWKQWKAKYSFLSFFLFTLLSFSIICIAGKSDFPIFAYIPVLSNLETFRFMTLFHIVALFYIGIALYFLFSFSLQQFNNEISNSKINQVRRYALFLLLFIIIITPVFYERIKTFQEKELTLNLSDYTSYWGIITAMKENKNNGRVFVTQESGLFSKFEALHAIPFLTGKPILTSVTIGSHDSLSAYYLSLPLPLELYGLFGVDFFITKKDGDGSMESGGGGLEELTLYISEKPAGYFSVANVPFQLNATPLAAREAVVTWLFSIGTSGNTEIDFIEIGVFEALQKNTIFFTNIKNQDMLTFEDTSSLREEHQKKQEIVVKSIDLIDKSPIVTIITNANNETTKEMPLYYFLMNYSIENKAKTEIENEINKTKKCGTVLDEVIERGVYQATVLVNKDDRCFVALKVTYHPEWRVFVDGVEKELAMLSPSFMGVAVDSGQHEVVFYYKIFWYRIGLLILSVMSLVVAFFIRKNKR